MINRVVLTGRLTRDVDLRYTQGGAAVATFNLAVDRRFTNQQGEREADFVSCVIWRKSAENFANFFHKGSLVGIEGRIQTRNYANAYTSQKLLLKTSRSWNQKTLLVTVAIKIIGHKIIPVIRLLITVVPLIFKMIRYRSDLR